MRQLGQTEIIQGEHPRPAILSLSNESLRFPICFWRHLLLPLSYSRPGRTAIIRRPVLVHIDHSPLPAFVAAARVHRIFAKEKFHRVADARELTRGNEKIVPMKK